MSKDLLIEEICKIIIKHNMVDNNTSMDVHELANKTKTFVNGIYGEYEFLNLQQQILEDEFARWLP